MVLTIIVTVIESRSGRKPTTSAARAATLLLLDIIMGLVFLIYFVSSAPCAHPSL